MDPPTCLALLLLLAVLLERCVARPRDVDYEERTFGLKKKKLQLLCSLLQQQQGNSRTLEQFNSQQYGGGGGNNDRFLGSSGGGGICDNNNNNHDDDNDDNNHEGEGGGGVGHGQLLGSLVSGALTSLGGVRPQRYLRPVYRALRPWYRLF